MVDREILEAISALGKSDLKRLRILIDTKLCTSINEPKIAYKQQYIKSVLESCTSCPHGPYWYAEWSENGKRNTKYLGKMLNEIN